MNNSEPKVRQDQTEGTKFTLYYDEEDWMSGFAEDELSNNDPVYARNEGLFQEGAMTPKPFTLQSFEFSNWD